MTLHSLTRVCTVAIWSAVAATFLCAVPLSAADAMVSRIPRVRATEDAAIALLLQPNLPHQPTTSRVRSRAPSRHRPARS